MECSTARIHKIMETTGKAAYFTLTAVSEQAQRGERPWWHENVAYAIGWQVEHVYSYHRVDIARAFLSMSEQETVELIERIASKFSDHFKSMAVSKAVPRLLAKELTKAAKKETV